jgi:hypothetical protein
VQTPFRQITGITGYWIDDIRQGDYVVDIGANVGAFCIRAAKRCRHVAAFEPVTGDLLEENIRLNGVDVLVFRAALGRSGSVVIDWDGCLVRSPAFTLGEMIRIAGGCDFLKCDCEGAEWVINPHDLDGIRRIEMELHQPPIGMSPEPMLLEYISREFEFTIDRIPCHGPLGVMGILHAWRES